jgi:hypothetical protein
MAGRAADHVGDQEACQLPRSASNVLKRDEHCPS